MSGVKSWWKKMGCLSPSVWDQDHHHQENGNCLFVLRESGQPSPWS